MKLNEHVIMSNKQLTRLGVYIIGKEKRFFSFGVTDFKYNGVLHMPLNMSYTASSKLNTCVFLIDISLLLDLIILQKLKILIDFCA